jgi:hypothetical protein
MRENLLQWIRENGGADGVVPIHMLLVRQAMYARGEGVDLTASTKLSLEVFERAAVYRALKELFSLGLIEFLDTSGQPVVPTEKEISEAAAGQARSARFQTVRLTKKGRGE